MHSRTAAESPLAMRCSTDGLIDGLDRLFGSTARADATGLHFMSATIAKNDRRGAKSGGPVRCAVAAIISASAALVGRAAAAYRRWTGAFRARERRAARSPADSGSSSATR